MYETDAFLLKIKRNKRVVHIRWAIVANVEVFVFRFGTVGQSTAHLVGPVPNNLLAADKMSNHITGYDFITVFD